MHLEVVTPTGTAFSGDTDEVVAPGQDGEFGVLPGHSPFISAMKPGVLKYRAGGGFTQLAVSTGLVEVDGHDKVVVLTERSEKPESIDAAQAKRELDEADHAAAKGERGADEKRAWAQAKLDAKK